MNKFLAHFNINKFSNIRNLTQLIFLITTIYIGIEFYLFVSSLETGVIPDIDRPPGVEGFLPISALISLKYFFYTGVVNNIHPSGLVILLFITVLSVIIKKSFCSWVCPIGFVSELLGKAHLKLFDKGLKINKFFDYPLRGIKYILLFFFLYTIFLKMNFSSINQFLISPYNVVADIKMLKYFTDISPLTLSVITAIFILTVFIRNFWCRYLCPYGAYLGLLSFISPYKIRRDEKSCSSCRKCDNICPSNINISSQNSIISDECFSCGSCIDVCPEKDVLKSALPGGKVSLKPVIIALTAIIIFAGGSTLAEYKGKWQNAVTKQKYIGYMLKTGLIDISEIKDPMNFVKALDRDGKRAFMMQMMKNR